jgi:thiol-disulfide isomerase/thioredoxin
VQKVIAGLIVCAAVLAAASAFGVIWQRRNGTLHPKAVRPKAEPTDQGTLAAAGTLSPAQLGQPLGARATLVQFSTAFCAPCRATRRILSDVATMVEGVKHLEIDAESRLDLVRDLGIRRTPTVLVLGPDGEIIRRGSGQPRKADVIAALGDAVTTTRDDSRHAGT